MSDQEKKVEVYSEQFLSVITETALTTLEKHLEKRGIGKTALNLLNSIVLLIHAKYIFKYKEKHMQSVVEDVKNILPSLSVDVVYLKGMFPAPEIKVMLDSVLEMQAQQ